MEKRSANADNWTWLSQVVGGADKGGIIVREERSEFTKYGLGLRYPVSKVILQ